MKIEINYDLLDKIREAKTGFSLNKFNNFVTRRTVVAGTIAITLGAAVGDPLEFVLKLTPFYFSLYSITFGISEAIMNKQLREIAIKQLRLLSCDLKDINIDTSYELLLDSENYKTEYKLKLNKYNIPYIKQDKYINIPTYDDGSIREVSIVQEHVVGTKKYSLSYGSPKKVLRPSFNPI